MLHVAHEWDLGVERGPDWIFVRPHDPLDGDDAPQLAAQAWSLMKQNFSNRIVLELDDIGPLRSYLIGQLILLYKRVHTAGGLMRICGLSPENESVLLMSRLAGMLPNYADREEAVMCSRPLQPR